MSNQKNIFVKVLSIYPIKELTGYIRVHVTDTEGKVFDVELDGVVNVGDEIDICVYDIDWTPRFARIVQNRTQMAIIKEFVDRNRQK